MHQKIGIVTESVCDLPPKMLDQYDIRVIYFTVKTDRGCFYDTNEITARNVLEYMSREERAVISSPPEPDVYRQAYEKALEAYEELVHITISRHTSDSYAVATQAASDMGEQGKRVHIFDSGHLSTGQGQLVLMAAQMAREGSSAEEILAGLETGRSKISTSFIVENVNFLYYNGRLSEKVKNLCGRLSLHPVLSMKNGELGLSAVIAGQYEKACDKYIKKLLKKSKNIDTRRVFLTHAGCSAGMLERVKAEMGKYCKPEELIVTEASAAVSGNCGPNAFGILFSER